MSSSRKKRPDWPWRPAAKSVTCSVPKCSECGRAPMHEGRDDETNTSVLYCGSCGHQEILN